MSNPNVSVLDPPNHLRQFDANCGNIRYVSDPLHDITSILQKTSHCEFCKNNPSLRWLYLQKNFNPLNANPQKWIKTLEQFVGNLPTNCLSLFDHFVMLALKWLKSMEDIQVPLWETVKKSEYMSSVYFH